MKPYTDTEGLEHIVLEESWVLAIMATPGQLVFKVEFVLTAEHPLYQPPLPGTVECTRRGELCFSKVMSLQWAEQGAPPSRDPDGEIDYSNIDAFEWSSGFYRLESHWGFMAVTGGNVQVTIDDTGS